MIDKNDHISTIQGWQSSTCTLRVLNNLWLQVQVQLEGQQAGRKADSG